MHQRREDGRSVQLLTAQPSSPKSVVVPKKTKKALSQRRSERKRDQLNISLYEAFKDNGVSVLKDNEEETANLLRGIQWPTTMISLS